MMIQISFSFFYALATLSLLPAVDAQSKKSTVYSIGVAAVHEPVDVMPQCGTSFIEARQRLEDEFALFGVDEGRKLQGWWNTWNWCYYYCRPYSQRECHYYSQGRCGNGRKMKEASELSDDDVPSDVAGECLRRKKILSLALKEEAAEAASLSEDCREYFQHGWEFKCDYHIVE